MVYYSKGQRLRPNQRVARLFVASDPFFYDQGLVSGKILFYLDRAITTTLCVCTTTVESGSWNSIFMWWKPGSGPLAAARCLQNSSILIVIFTLYLFRKSDINASHEYGNQHRFGGRLPNYVASSLKNSTLRQVPNTVAHVEKPNDAQQMK